MDLIRRNFLMSETSETPSGESIRLPVSFQRNDSVLGGIVGQNADFALALPGGMANLPSCLYGLEAS